MSSEPKAYFLKRLVRAWQSPETLGTPKLRDGRIGLLLAAILLIAGAAVVKPEALFSSPLFDLGAGIARPITPAPWSAEVREAPEFVCLLIIGGLRADQAGFGSEPSGELQALESFAAQSSRFESVGAQASNPRVSLKSLLTGTYPANLILKQTGADQRTLIGMHNQAAFLRDTFDAVQSDLGHWLAAEGYQVKAFSDAQWVLESPGFGEGFSAPDRAGDSAIVAGTHWAWQLLGQAPQGRQALILHLEELLPKGVSVRDSKVAYEHKLKLLDAELERLFDALKTAGLWDAGLLMLTSDHGTSLGERGLMGHGELYLEQLMVPLGIKFPKQWKVPPSCLSGGAELVDVLPTLQALCAGALQNLDGRSLLPIAFSGHSGRKLLLAQTSSGDFGGNPTTRSAIEPKRWQLIQDARAGGLLFYALGNDPEALQPVQPGTLQVPRFVTSLFGARMQEKN